MRHDEAVTLTAYSLCMPTSPVHAVLSPDEKLERLDPITSIPFFAVHLASLAVFFLPFHWYYPVVAVGLYFFRMFGITGGYHRYFSHRSYKTGRAMQFLLALLGTLATQKGVLWWAAHHRDHHKFSDQPEDIHSPLQKGFWWSHVGWILCRKYDETKTERIRDFAKYPELRWLNKYHIVPPVLLAVLLFAVGGWGLLVWGFFLSTVMLWHGTFTINSLSHVFGSTRYQTTDTSKNNFLLAMLTMGEGWHNNHHYYMSTANQGWFWWEIDVSYYILKTLSVFGLVWDLRTPPKHIQYAHKLPQPAVAAPAPAGVPARALASEAD
jgi:stearoyl-CoA desaturase (delta-9 desaturase)